MTMKIVKTRDSATSLLRKIGINPRDYNLFIKTATGGCGVDVEAAKRHVKKGIIVVAEVIAPKITVAASKVKKAKTEEIKKEEEKPVKVSISSVARQLILDGKSNKEIFGILQSQFKIDGTKKHYPSWYRSEMKRKGLIK